MLWMGRYVQLWISINYSSCVVPPIMSALVAVRVWISKIKNPLIYSYDTNLVPGKLASSRHPSIHQFYPHGYLPRSIVICSVVVALWPDDGLYGKIRCICVASFSRVWPILCLMPYAYSFICLVSIPPGKYAIWRWFSKLRSSFRNIFSYSGPKASTKYQILELQCLSLTMLTPCLPTGVMITGTSGLTGIYRVVYHGGQFFKYV